MRVLELFESKSKTGYHLTDVKSAISIIKGANLKLPFSFARSTRSGFFSMMIGPDSVMLVLNRSKIRSQSFKNHDGAKELNSLGVHSDEYEERIEGSGFVDFDITSILEIRVLKLKERSKGANFYTDEQLNTLQKLCDLNSIPLKFVNSKTDFRKP